MTELIEVTADELVIGDIIAIVAEGKGDIWTRGFVSMVYTKRDQTDVLKVNTHWVVWSMEPDISEAQRWRPLPHGPLKRREWLDEELRAQLYEVSRQRLAYKQANNISDA